MAEAVVKAGKSTSEHVFEYVSMGAAFVLFGGGIAVELWTTAPDWFGAVLGGVGMVSVKLGSMGYTKWRTLLKIEAVKK